MAGLRALERPVGARLDPRRVRRARWSSSCSLGGVLDRPLRAAQDDDRAPTCSAPLAIGAAGCARDHRRRSELWQLADLRGRHRGRRRRCFAPAFGSIVPEIVPSRARSRRRTRSTSSCARWRASLGPAIGGMRDRDRRAPASRSSIDACTFVRLDRRPRSLLTARPLERRTGHRSVVARRRARGFAFVRRARPGSGRRCGDRGAAERRGARGAQRAAPVRGSGTTSRASAAGARRWCTRPTAAGALVSSLAYGQRGLPRRFVRRDVRRLGGRALFAIAGYGLATGVPAAGRASASSAGVGARARPGDLGDDDAPARPARAARARHEHRLAGLDEPDAGGDRSRSGSSATRVRRAARRSSWRPASSAAR